MKPLPPWSGDDDAMFFWLDEELTDKFWFEINAVNPPFIEGALSHARGGNVDWLRQLVAKQVDPRAAVFVQPLKPGSGNWVRRVSGPNDQFLLLRSAVEDVPRIRALWKTNYNRERRYEKKGEKKAEWFAARRWGVKEKDVRDRCEHRSGPKKARP